MGWVCIVTRFVSRRMWSRMSGSSNLAAPLNLALGGWDVEKPPLVGSFSENQWIGLRENLQESPIFNGKIMVSCKFSLKPIHWEKDFHVLQGAAWGCAYIICTPPQHISTQAYYTWNRSGFSWTWQLFHVRIQSTTQHVWPPRLGDTRWPSLRVTRLFMSDSLTLLDCLMRSNTKFHLGWSGTRYCPNGWTYLLVIHGNST